MSQTDRPPSAAHTHDVGAGGAVQPPDSAGSPAQTGPGEPDAGGPVTIDAATLHTIRQSFRARREAAIAQFRARRQPGPLLARLTAATDACTRDLWRAAALPPEVVLAAVGGYGRGELYPHSDVDLLILTPASGCEAALGGAVEAFVGGCWDVGLSIGHSVRSLDECSSEAATDITVQTSVLEARWLAGERSRFDALPTWMVQWSKVDASLLSFSDVNGDGLLQLGEIRMGADLVMLATPELGGLPYVVSGLVAAGGLAAALSTADGLLLTISNALVRDMYYAQRMRRALPQQRVILSKFALLSVAMLAATVAALRPAGILPMVTASFSLAAAGLVPGMLLGLFWRGATRAGVVAGMLAGLGVVVYYMLVNTDTLRSALGLVAEGGLWWSIQPNSAGVFGVPAGLLVTWLVSLWTAKKAA